MKSEHGICLVTKYYNEAYYFYIRDRMFMMMDLDNISYIVNNLCL